MRFKTEIFDEYEKIAEKHGLISKESQVRDPKVRYDSKELSELALLYGVTPEGTEESVIDKAHPETAVVAPAYDAMNAVVENLRERQDIMSWIALKVPDGHITHKRYVSAYKDLMDSVIKIGFAMDSNDEAELMKLADSCAERLHKEAIGPVAIGAVLAGALALGYYFTQMPVSVQNVQANADMVLNRIPDGKGYSNDLRGVVNEIKTVGTQLTELVPTLGQMYREIRTAVAKKDRDAAVEVYSSYASQRQVAAELIATINEKKGMLQSFKADVETETDMSQGQQYDWWQKVLDVADYLYQDKEEALPGAIDALTKSIDDLVAKLKSVLTNAQGFAGQIQQALEPEKEVAMPNPLEA